MFGVEKVPVVISVEDFESFKRLIEKIPSHVYVVVKNEYAQLWLIPLKTSRNRHVFGFFPQSVEDLEKAEKLLEEKGFEIIKGGVSFK